MQRGFVTAAAEIAAHAPEVYAILADYRDGHPHILPKPYFAELRVEEGGIGAGTIIYLRMRVFGQERVYRQHITEPEPGRVLVETDLDTGSVTTFTVTPIHSEQRALVQITTEWPVRPGFAGWLERVMTGRVLKSIYTKELQQLAAWVASERSSGHRGRHHYRSV